VQRQDAAPSSPERADRPAESQPFHVTDREEAQARRCFDVLVSSSCAHFDGHFPDHPVLPAIAQLELVAGLIRRVRPSMARLTAIDSLRLLRPVRPGHELVAEVSVSSPDAPARFEIREGATVISRGVVRWAEESTG
jgi:3-hydroxymyristoyl/3-hydroxydecanoyl-(acyl carrier protein) dehydratase